MNTISEHFTTHLEDMGVLKLYTSMFNNLNKGSDLIFLSAYTKQDYLNRDRLRVLYDKMNLSGADYNQILEQIKQYSALNSLQEVSSLLPDISVNILELIYLKPESVAKLIVQQITELQTYTPNLQSKITNETIRVYLALAEKYYLFSCNFVKLYQDNIDIFDKSLSTFLNIEISKRVVYLQKTIHQLRGTRICILDNETTGFIKPRPIQISFLLFDMNFNFIKSYNRYIKQEHIEPGAITSHGITEEMLMNKLPSVEPEEAFEEIQALLKDEKVIFIAHNANYDVRVLNNLALQCTGESFDNLKYICTYQNYNQFSDLTVTDHTLSTLLLQHKILKKDIVDECRKLFNITDSTLDFHNSMVDTTALYLFIKESKFFTNI